VGLLERGVAEVKIRGIYFVGKRVKSETRDVGNGYSLKEKARWQSGGCILIYRSEER
jgi:hypothetical protein